MNKYYRMNLETKKQGSSFSNSNNPTLPDVKRALNMPLLQVKSSSLEDMEALIILIIQKLNQLFYRILTILNNCLKAILYF